MRLWSFWALCLSALPGLLQAGPVFVEGDRDTSRICKPPPPWRIGDEAPMEVLRGKVGVVALLKASWHFCLTQAARLGGLRDKLAQGGLNDVGFLVVNEREAQSRAMFWELKRNVAEGIPVYQQAPFQDDVWAALQGDKDDFLVYDRCGQLTFYIVLPYSFLHYPFIEAAIRATYHKDICGNCSVVSNATLPMPRNSTHYNDTGVAASNNPVDMAGGEPVEAPQPVGVTEHTPHKHKDHQESQGPADGGQAHPHHHGHHDGHMHHSDHQHNHGGHHHGHRGH